MCDNIMDESEIRSRIDFGDDKGRQVWRFQLSTNQFPGQMHVE
jgi:hypothetical protein